MCLCPVTHVEIGVTVEVLGTELQSSLLVASPFAHRTTPMFGLHTLLVVFCAIVEKGWGFVPFSKCHCLHHLQLNVLLGAQVSGLVCSEKTSLLKFTSSGTFHLNVCMQKYTHIRVLGFILSRLILFLNGFLRKNLYSSLKVTLTYYFKNKENLAGGAYKVGYLNIIIQVEFKEELVDD